MARVASQRFFEKLHVCVFVSPDDNFSTFFRIGKDAHWNFAKICQNFSPWTPIWDHFVHFWIMSVPKQPTLKLKSESMKACWFLQNFEHLYYHSGRGGLEVGWQSLLAGQSPKDKNRTKYELLDDFYRGLIFNMFLFFFQFVNRVVMEIY